MSLPSRLRLLSRGVFLKDPVAVAPRIRRRCLSIPSSSSSKLLPVGSWASRLFRWYSHRLDTHPILTKSISSGLIAGAGDALCQGMIVRQTKVRASKNNSLGWWEPERTGRFLILGFLLVGPVIHVWYGALAKYVPGTQMTNVIKRVAMDQLVFTPIFLSAWLPSLWTLEGSTDNMPQRLVTLLPSLVIANWSLWVPTQVINFRFVPLKYQVLFSNCVSLVWNMFLSYRTGSNTEESTTTTE